MGKEKSVPSYKLNTGALIPYVGLGCGTPNPAEVKSYVLKAIEVGYRHFDTARMYKTEIPLGEALQEAFSAGLVKREDVFVTTKIPQDEMNPPEILPALRESLSNLQLEYVDLVLLHWPLRVRKGAGINVKDEDFLPLDLVGCWKALEPAVELGLAKSIGVSNFSVKRLKEIESQAKLVPAVNQVEMHPGCNQARLREYCSRKGIFICAWSPLGAPGTPWGSSVVMDNPILKEIAEKHGKTVAQVALRWALDNGVGVIVKSSNPERMVQNLELFDWALTQEDHRNIKETPAHRVFPGHQFCNATTSPYKSLEDLWDDDE